VIKNKNYLPKNLKYLRLRSGKSQAHIASYLGKRSTAISSWEAGLSTPSIADMIHLSDFYGIYVGDLIGKDIAKGVFDESFRVIKKGEVSGEVSGEVLADVEDIEERWKEFVIKNKLGKEYLKYFDKTDKKKSNLNSSIAKKLEDDISQLRAKIIELESKFPLEFEKKSTATKNDES